MKKLSYSATLLFLVVSIALTACKKESKDAEAAMTRRSEKASVKIANVEVRTYKPKIEAAGDLTPLNYAKISALTDGRLEKMDLDIGSEVKKGKVLFRVACTDYQLSFQQAQANLARVEADAEFAQQAKDRIEALREKNAVSGEDYDQAVAMAKKANAALGQARAAQRQARKTRGDCSVVAPFDGIVTAKFVQKGEFVRRGDRIIEFIDPKTLTAELKLPEKYAGGITSEASVVLNCGDYSGDVAGIIMAVNPKIDTANRTFTVKVIVDNANLKLQTGLYCSAKFDLPALNDQLAAHPKAIIRDNGQSSVWVVVDGKATLRKITEDGEFEDGWVRILDGLASGDTLIIEGKSGLFEGQEVTIAK